MSIFESMVTNRNHKSTFKYGRIVVCAFFFLLFIPLPQKPLFCSNMHAMTAIKLNSKYKYKIWIIECINMWQVQEKQHVVRCCCRRNNNKSISNRFVDKQRTMSSRIIEHPLKMIVCMCVCEHQLHRHMHAVYYVRLVNGLIIPLFSVAHCQLLGFCIVSFCSVLHYISGIWRSIWWFIFQMCQFHFHPVFSLLTIDCCGAYHGCCCCFTSYARSVFIYMVFFLLPFVCLALSLGTKWQKRIEGDTVKLKPNRSAH